MTKHIRIDLPFTLLTLIDNDFCAITARPSMGKTLYAMNTIKENSVIGKNRCLAFFVGNNKKAIYNLKLYREFTKHENINIFSMNFGRGDAFLFDLKRLVRDVNPDYVIIDGFEKLFKQYEIDLKLTPEVDQLLSDIRILSDEKKIPIIITTHILSTAELRITPPKPMLCDLGSNTLESTVDLILGLNSLYYYGYGLNSEGHDISKTTELHQLKPWRYELEPYTFRLGKEIRDYIPKE